MSVITARRLLPLHNSVSDAELLQQFAQSQDESAFAEIVRRHGGLVRGVAHRLLSDSDAAHDVFQAVFLLLAKRAKSIAWGRTVGPWLFQVACRMANKARVRQAQQSVRFVPAVEAPASTLHPADQLVWAEVRSVLDDELSRLPAIYRDPLLLCYLEGLTRDEAAEALACSLMVLKGRLERGRAALRRGLERRGLTLSVGLAVAFIPGSSISAKSSSALAKLAANSLIGGPIPSALKELLRMGSTGFTLRTISFTGLLALLTLGVAIGMTEPGQRPQTSQPKAQTWVDDKQEATSKTDDVPLPTGAVARLGSTRFRHAVLHNFVVLGDGKTAITSGGDGVLRYWHLETGRQIQMVALQGRTATHGAITPSPDGKLFASPNGLRLDIWDAETGKQLKSFPLQQPVEGFLSFSPNGDYLVVGRSNRSASLLAWRTDNAERPLPLPKTERRDNSFHAHFTPDSSRIVVGGVERLCVFEVKDFKMVLELECGAIRSVVTPDGKTLVVNSNTADVCLYDLTTGKERERFPLSGYRWDWLMSSAISPDGRRLACCFQDTTCLMDLTTGKIRHTACRGWNCAFTPDGRTLVANEGETRLRIWDTATGREKNPNPGNLGWSPIFAVSPDGRVLASSDSSGFWTSQEVTLWDLVNGRVIRELPLRGRDKCHSVRGLAFSPDGKVLFAAQIGGFIQSWDSATGAERGSIQLARYPHAQLGNPNFNLTFTRCQISPDGRRVTTLELRSDGDAVPRMHTCLGVWDLSSGKIISEWEYPELLHDCWDWAWLGNSSVALSRPGGLSIVATESGKVKFNLTSTAVQGPFVASPDGRLVALAPVPTDDSQPNSVRIWEAATGRPVATIQTGKVDYMALGPDDRTLVTVESRMLHIWDLATGRERGRRQFDVIADGLILAPDGRFAITSLQDGTGFVWDLTAFPLEVLAEKATENDIAGWWKDLLADDAAVAYAAVWRLTAVHPVAVLKYLQANLKLATLPNAGEVAALVKDLGDDEFAVRERASKRLVELGLAVAPALREATRTGSPEIRKRAGEILGKLLPPQSPEVSRRIRTVAILERIGSAEARKLLANLADGPVGYSETDAAVAALKRLSQQIRTP